MNVIRMLRIHAVNLVANSGNTTYRVLVVMILRNHTTLQEVETICISEYSSVHYWICIRSGWRHGNFNIMIIWNIFNLSNILNISSLRICHNECLMYVFHAGNIWVSTQHCSYRWPGAKAPGHQYPQCWPNIHIRPVSYRYVRIIGSNICK